ncbi:hypothetical protein AVEN_67642-1 [Araneus ventricosus]|uniref:Uncharacterized protein n=1 Tax=Araneus ventricosus TaxID=182803 RepID=A0A4Y2IB55_ARAVE|nr:hypothetical protein AVEN_67642-1 [Araneus ventricosus]
MLRMHQNNPTHHKNHRFLETNCKNSPSDVCDEALHSSTDTQLITHKGSRSCTGLKKVAIRKNYGCENVCKGVIRKRVMDASYVTCRNLHSSRKEWSGLGGTKQRGLGKD